MDVLQAIQTRRSIRTFQNRAVNREEILTILDAAMRAPSALNHQPWEFIVVSGDLIADLGKIWATCLTRIAAARGEKFPEEVLKNAENFGGAPHLILVLSIRSDKPSYQKAYLESASAAMENLILAAHGRGIGTCWMTGPFDDEAAIRKILTIPERYELVALTPLGYAKGPVDPPREAPDLRQKIRWVS